MAVVTIVIAGVVVLSGCDTAPAGVDPASTTGSSETTRASETTAAPTTAPPTTAAASSDPASLAIDRLIEALNAQDAEKMAGIFGQDVVLTRPSGQESVGADAVTWWAQNFGRETAERITEPFHASDGRTYFLLEFTLLAGGSPMFVFDLEMEGERLVGMGIRDQTFEEALATGEIDDLYQAFNDQDLDRLNPKFEAMTYTSPSGVEFTGADAAEHWAEAFGFVVTRTSGVFAIGDGAYGFVSEHREPDSGRSTAYAVEIERSGSRITSMTERRPQT